MTAPIVTARSRRSAALLRRAWRAGRGLGDDLARARRGLPSSPVTYRHARRLHVRTAGVTSEVLRAALRAVPGPDRVSARRMRAGLSSADRAALAELQRVGLARIDPVLDADAVRRLREFATTAPGVVRHADGSMTRGTYADRPADAILVQIPGDFAWAQGPIQSLMASRRLHQLVGALYGLGAVVHTSQLNWSCVPSSHSPTESSPRFARTWHTDFDGLGAIRVHINLTDVDDGAAPMEYLPGSHRLGALRGRGFRRVDLGEADDAVARRFGRVEPRRLTGPAGTTYLSNPRGLHRAQRPTETDRLFLTLPIQAGSFAGAVTRRRSVPAVDAAFADLAAVPGGPLRLFDVVDAAGRVPTARLVGP